MSLSEVLDDLARYPSTSAAATLTLPPNSYTDPDVHEHELATVFHTEWVLVARTARFARPGDYLGIELAGEPLLIVRDRDGVLRALSAVCRHRAMLLVPDGGGHTDTLTCPYHLWNYGLDGKLRGAPMMRDVPGFDRATCALPSFHVQEWEGFVFVNLSPSPPPLLPRLQPISDALAGHQLGGGIEVAAYDQRWEANWKLAVENGSESYHHMGLHQQTVEPALPSRGTQTCETTEHYSHHRTPIAAGMRSNLGAAPGAATVLGPDRWEAMEVYTIFPATVLLVTGDLCSWLTALPQGVAGCRVLNGFTYPGALDGLIDTSATQQFMDAVNAEDRTAQEAVQRGLTSRHAARSLLSPHEGALAGFYHYIAGRLTS